MRRRHLATAASLALLLLLVSALRAVAGRERYASFDRDQAWGPGGDALRVLGGSLFDAGDGDLLLSSEVRSLPAGFVPGAPSEPLALPQVPPVAPLLGRDT